jgi:hypothetical protein
MSRLPAPNGNQLNFTIKVNELRPMVISEMLGAFEAAPKKHLEQLRLFDLLLESDSGQALRHGVYMFFDEKGECIYVGMCSSSHFAHRIGGHFGMSPKYEMNTFLRRVVNSLAMEESKDGGYDHYVSALSQMGKYSILIIDANNTGKKFVRALERLLHTVMKPRLNFPNGIPKTYKPLAFEIGFDEAIVRCGGS